MPEYRRVCVKLEEVKAEVRENRKLLRKALGKLEGTTVPEDNGQIPEGIPSLPLVTVEDLTEINEILKTDPSKRRQLVSVLLLSYVKKCEKILYVYDIFQ